jgi:hypothetical protein
MDRNVLILNGQVPSMRSIRFIYFSLKISHHNEKITLMEIWGLGSYLFFFGSKKTTIDRVFMFKKEKKTTTTTTPKCMQPSRFPNKASMLVFNSGIFTPEFSVTSTGDRHPYYCRL